MFFIIWDRYALGIVKVDNGPRSHIVDIIDTKNMKFER